MNALFDARLVDRRIFLRNYVVDANIGIHAHEKMARSALHSMSTYSCRSRCPRRVMIEFMK